MYGAIIGDIVGSRFEFSNIKTKEFELFADKCEATDDSIMTIAIADAILKCNGDYTDLSKLAAKSMRNIGQHYPRCGYGGRFFDWMYGAIQGPYNSFGNGAAMRVSACGWAAGSLEEAKEMARKVTEVTHNHPEGIKGAEAVASIIYMIGWHHQNKQDIRKYVNDHYYDLNFTIDEIRPTYKFNETCQETVPQAIECFLEANDFEDAIRTAVSLGGDSDTLAAITGSIAGVYWPIPGWMKEKARKYLDDDLKRILDAFMARYEE